MSIAVGSIVRRHGETRQYRVLGYRDWHPADKREIVSLAILEPMAESMIKRSYERLEELVQVEGLKPL